jgi:hypothetical protein
MSAMMGIFRAVMDLPLLMKVRGGCQHVMGVFVASVDATVAGNIAQLTTVRFKVAIKKQLAEVGLCVRQSVGVCWCVGAWWVPKVTP